MIEQVDPKDIILKTKQYEFADGLRDIQLGLTLIVIGFVWFGWMYEPNWLRFMIQLGRDYGRWATIVAFLLVLSLPVIAAIGMQRIMESVRRRWLWRESGMVKASPFLVPSYISFIAVVIFILIIGLGLRYQSNFKTDDFYLMSLIMLASGWAFGITLIGLGRSLRVSRYVVMGVVGGIASTGLLLFQSSLSGAGMISFFGWGAILIASGLIVLIQVWPAFKEGSHAG